MLNIKEFPKDMSSFPIDSSNMKNAWYPGCFVKPWKFMEKKGLFIPILLPA